MKNLLAFGVIVTAAITAVIVALLLDRAKYYWANRFEPTKSRTTYDYLDRHYQLKIRAKTAAAVGGVLLVIQAFIVAATH